MNQPSLPVLMQDEPGYITGIVRLGDEIGQQCSECGAFRPGIKAIDILLGGYRFHLCDRTNLIRRCRDCYTAVVKACPERRCKS